MGSVVTNKIAVERFFLRTEIATFAAARALGEIMVHEVQQEAGRIFHERTGDLFNSFRSIVKKDRATDSFIVGVGSNVRYAQYLENGSPPHLIDALAGGSRRTAIGRFAGRSKRLRSYPDNPDPLLRPQVSVNHPGTKATFFMEEGVENAIRRFPAVHLGR